jgi:Protein of unknown function (DUF3034)
VAVTAAEYCTKSDNLSAFEEVDFKDAIVAWIPNKRVSLTLTYADLGSIADKLDQRGRYVSAQGSF